MGKPEGAAGREPVNAGTDAIGWVNGQAVGSSALDDYLAHVCGSVVADRLGLGLGARVQPDPHAGNGHQEGSDADGRRVKALRTWAIKNLLVDRLLSVEASRLAVTAPWSPQAWLEQLQAAGEVENRPPSRDEMLACYEGTPWRWRQAEARHVRHVLLSDRSVAEDLSMRWPVAPYDPDGFVELAFRASADEGSRPEGGDLGWIERGALSGPLEEAIFACPPGTACGPVPSAFGWHLVAVDSVRPERLRPFEQCKPQIEAELAEHRLQAAWREWLDHRIAEAIEVPPGTEHPALPGLPGTAHRH